MNGYNFLSVFQYPTPCFYLIPKYWPKEVTKKNKKYQLGNIVWFNTTTSELNWLEMYDRQCRELVLKSWELKIWWGSLPMTDILPSDVLHGGLACVTYTSWKFSNENKLCAVLCKKEKQIFLQGHLNYYSWVTITVHWHLGSLNDSKGYGFHTLIFFRAREHSKYKSLFCYLSGFFPFMFTVIYLYNSNDDPK